jgi:hypothetical protein
VCDGCGVSDGRVRVSARGREVGDKVKCVCRSNVYGVYGGGSCEMIVDSAIQNTKRWKTLLVYMRKLVDATRVGRLEGPVRQVRGNFGREVG